MSTPSNTRLPTVHQYAPGPRRLEKIPEPPAFEEGLHLQVCCTALSHPEPVAVVTRAHVCPQSFFAIGNAITPSGLEVMRQLVHAFNDAVDSLPELPEVCLLQLLRCTSMKRSVLDH